MVNCLKYVESERFGFVVEFSNEIDGVDSFLVMIMGKEVVGRFGNFEDEDMD